MPTVTASARSASLPSTQRVLSDDQLRWVLAVNSRRRGAFDGFPAGRILAPYLDLPSPPIVRASVKKA